MIFKSRLLQIALIVLATAAARADSNSCRDLFVNRAPLRAVTASPLFDSLSARQLRRFQAAVDRLSSIALEKPELTAEEAARVVSIFYEAKSENILSIRQMLGLKYPKAYKDLLRMEFESAQLAEGLHKALRDESWIAEGAAPLAVGPRNARFFSIWLGFEVALQLVWLQFNPYPTLPGFIAPVIVPNAKSQQLGEFVARAKAVGFDRAYEELGSKMGSYRTLSLTYRTLQNAIVVATLAYILWELERSREIAAGQKKKTGDDLVSEAHHDTEVFQAVAVQIISGQIAKVEEQEKSAPPQERYKYEIRLQGLQKNLEIAQHPERFKLSN